MLTAKQARFVSEYLVDLNATQAATRAGYATKRADAIGYENLRKPDIQSAIAAAIAERAQRTEITQDRVLTELGRIAFADIRKATQWGASVPFTDPKSGKTVVANGISLVPSDELDDDTAAAISEISETQQGLKVKFHDKLAALVSIGKHLGMFIERQEIKAEVIASRALQDMTDEELEKEMIRHGLRPRFIHE